MRDGIYHVRFSSNVGSTGEGLAVVRAGTVNGGDGGYVYVGHLESSDESLTGHLHVKRWNPGHVSVFGPLDHFDLALNGRSEPTTEDFSASGRVQNQPTLTISIAGRFLSAAA